MYLPVLELFEHEGRSAPSNTRADQQRIPSCRAPCVVLNTAVAKDRRLWPLPGSRGKRNRGISMLGSDLPRVLRST